jgi:hypothetical protein
MRTLPVQNLHKFKLKVSEQFSNDFKERFFIVCKDTKSKSDFQISSLARWAFQYFSLLNMVKPKKESPFSISRLLHHRCRGHGCRPDSLSSAANMVQAESNRVYSNCRDEAHIVSSETNLNNYIQSAKFSCSNLLSCCRCRHIQAPHNRQEMKIFHYVCQSENIN